MNAELVEKFVTYGLVEPVRTDEGVAWFDVASIGRVRTIARLRRDLGINLAGIATAFDLLSRIEALKRELAELRTRDERTDIPIRPLTAKRWS
jgi:DNA-binding transcriptional MerR regulator